MPARVRLKALLTLAMTLVLVVALLRHLNGAAVGQALLHANPLLVGLALLGATAFNTFQSAELLRQALRAVNVEVPYRSAFLATSGSLMLQAVLPLSTGNLGRIAYLARTHGVDVMRGSVATAGTLGLKLASLLLLALTGWLWRPQAEFVRVPVLLALCFGAVAAVVVTPALVKLLAARFGHVRRVGALFVALDQLRGSLRKGALAWTAVHALLAVGSELVVIGLLLRAVGASVDPLAIVSFFPLVVIGAKVPITVLGVGTREALSLALFQGMASPEQLLTSGLLFSFIEHLFPALIGVFLTGPFLMRILSGGHMSFLPEETVARPVESPSRLKESRRRAAGSGNP